MAIYWSTRYCGPRSKWNAVIGAAGGGRRVLAGLLAAAGILMLAQSASASPRPAAQGAAGDAPSAALVLAQGKMGAPRGPAPPRVAPTFNRHSGAARPRGSTAKPPRNLPRTGLSRGKSVRPPGGPRRGAATPRRDPRGAHFRRYNQPRPELKPQPSKGWPGKAAATRGPANKLYGAHHQYIKDKLAGRSASSRPKPPPLAAPKLGTRGTLNKPFNHHSGAAKAKPPANKGGFRKLTLEHRSVIRDHFNSRR